MHYWLIDNSIQIQVRVSTANNQIKTPVTHSTSESGLRPAPEAARRMCNTNLFWKAGLRPDWGQVDSVHLWMWFEASLSPAISRCNTKVDSGRLISGSDVTCHHNQHNTSGALCHLLLCNSLFLSFYHFLFLSFLMLFFVFIILSLFLSVFP